MRDLQQHPDVESEIEDYALYLASSSDRAPFAFVGEVRSAFRHLCEHPAIGHFVHRDFRRYNLRRFSHAVIYQENGDKIYVIAVMHEKRHPDYWKKRIAKETIHELPQLRGLVVHRLQLRNLRGGLEILPHIRRGSGAHRLPLAGGFEQAGDGVIQAVHITLAHEEAGHILSHGLGDAAVESGDHRQAGGHGFQHRVRNAFLVAILHQAAGVDEHM